jgi:hypothetical protein
VSPEDKLERDGRRNERLVTYASLALSLLALFLFLLWTFATWWADGAAWHKLFGGH